MSIWLQFIDDNILVCPHCHARNIMDWKYCGGVSECAGCGCSLWWKRQVVLTDSTKPNRKMLANARKKLSGKRPKMKILRAAQWDKPLLD